MTKFKVTGFYDSYTHDRSSVQHATINAHVETAEEAAAIAAQFPKSAKIKGGAVSTAEGEKGYISGSVKLKADAANKGVNETGVKRYQSWLKSAQKLGHEVEYSGGNYGNSYKSQEEFEQALLQKGQF